MKVAARGRGAATHRKARMCPEVIEPAAAPDSTALAAMDGRTSVTASTIKVSTETFLQTILMQTEEQRGPVSEARYSFSTSAAVA